MTAGISEGSLWHRWDPHIHAPGTILSDQYPAAEGWEEFLSRIENSDPPVRALGITDYYSTATYEQAVARRQSGRLPGVDLIFPNVELRLGVGTASGTPVNVHLLVCPDDADHVERTHTFLSNLKFEAIGERYRCTPEEIRRLGRAHDQSAISDEQALAVGTNQFKVDLADLREAFRSSAWAQANILFGVAASSTDGTAGLQSDASLARLRREIERAAHIIFSGRPGDRSFWLGQHSSMPREQIIEQYGNIKPCLHGSDAHRPEQVAAPDQDRRCWLKGSLRFETLRQAIIEPDMRVHVGATVPPAAPPSQTIAAIRFRNAEFIDAASIPINPGLVGIIGARGSGKTALADLIAVGAEAFSLNANRLSFVDRARDHLQGTTVVLEWSDGTETAASVDGLEERDSGSNPRVRYLSQQFVDRLCSAEGLTDELLREIQRVVFLSHPTEERLGSTDFDELLYLKAEPARTARAHYEAELRNLSDELVSEQEKAANLTYLGRQCAQIQQAIQNSISDRLALVGKSGGSEERLAAYTVVATALQTRKSQYEQLERRKNALESLSAEVGLTRSRTIPEMLRQMRLRHQGAHLPEHMWPRFALQFTGDVDEAIAEELRGVVAELSSISGIPTSPPSATEVSLLPSGSNLTEQTIALLTEEARRLERLVGVDNESTRALHSLNSKIAADEGKLANLKRQIEIAQKAPARIEEIRAERRVAYGKVFEALVEEQSKLTALYAPLSARIEAETGSARKLAFAVRRRVDLVDWGARGEQLLDLRKGSTLRRGTLAEIAAELLYTAWAQGSAQEATAALSNFRERFDGAIVECCPYDRTDPANADNIRRWAGEVSAWLYGTSHIQINYGVQFDGTDVERLSPGTRGIVLLLLYLVIDIDDNRPLLIDQPEENLDPKSIFVELVSRFRTAKQRRQIIIVTHNANLIVNADADQVIVAACGPHRTGTLPKISYVAGGLEEPAIRAHVCDILEGGELAFKERAKRLRVQI